MPTMLIAIGGNALLRPGEPAAVGRERAHIADSCGYIAPLVSQGWRVVITHGNGPQVGHGLDGDRSADPRFNAGRDRSPPLPAPTAGG